MPEVNFNLLNPSAELYSGPQVQMDPVAAYEKAKTQRQSNMLAQLYAKHYDPQTGGVNYNALIPEAAQSGLDVSKLMPGVREQQESMASIAQKDALRRQEEATAAAKQQEMFKSNVDTAMKWSRSQLDNIKTPDEYLKWHEANHTNPYLAEFFKQNNISKEDRRSEINSLLSQEGGLQKLIDMSKQGLDNYLGVKPEDTEPKLGTYQPGDYTTASWAKFVKTKDPAALQLKPTASATAAQDDKNVVARTIEQDDGTVLLLNKFGEQIGTTKGKKSAAVVKAEIAKEQLVKDLDSTIAELTEAVKPGGLIEKSTGSGIGRAVDVGANIFGATTEGQLAIASLQPIYDKVLKMVPRFEGPQSDKDTQSYREAAGQLANPSLPNKVKMAAAKTILRLMNARKDQFTTKEATDAGVTSTAGGGTNIDALVNKYATPSGGKK